MPEDEVQRVRQAEGVRQSLDALGKRRAAAAAELAATRSEAMALIPVADELGISKMEVARLLGITRNAYYSWASELDGK